MPIPLDPYVAECAAALTAAGHDVTETWTEATDPADHNILIADGWQLVLIWDGSWTWIHYPRPSATFRSAGPLFGPGVSPDPADVVAEVAHVVATIVHA